MTSYNLVNGVRMSANKKLNDVLREELGFDGVIVSDWEAVQDPLDTLHSGLDLEFPHNDKHAVEMQEHLAAGRIDLECLDKCSGRIIALGEKATAEKKLQKIHYSVEERIAISQEVEEEGIVLLKNNGVLPLKKDISSIALIGPSSAAQKIGGYSSMPQFHIPSVYEQLKEALGDGVTIRQCNGCAITQEGNGPRVVDGQPHLTTAGEETLLDELEEAVAIASECEVIVMVGGDNTVTSGEGRDRCELTLHGRQRELIEKLAALGKPLILVLENGKPLDISRESEVCDGILMTFFGGESGAKAIVEALLGRFSPAGRLPISLPRSSTRIPCYYSMLPGGDLQFLEGPKGPLYAFGHGLSYTSFEYSDLRIEKTGPTDAAVTCTVTNTGPMEAEEVVQLYIEDVDSSVVTPLKLLKDFHRLRLAPGEGKEVRFALGYDHFKLMDIRYEWTVEPGRFRILVGSGSEDIRLEGDIQKQFPETHKNNLQAILTARGVSRRDIPSLHPRKSRQLRYARVSSGC